MSNQSANNSQISSSVLTLLLCKITPDSKTNHTAQYAKLYDGHNLAGTKPLGRYITLGGVDAVSVYKLGNTDSPDWLEKVLEDRQKIISKLSGTVTYHPVHLVGEEPRPETNKILFITFVYGVEDGKEFKNQVDSCLKDNGVTDAATYIYQCINISERVVFVYSNNISGTLTGISSIENKKYARKVYTTASFLLSANVASGGELFSPGVMQTLKNSNNDEFCICIKGSVKDHSKWQTVTKRICFALNVKPCDAVHYNYGEDDFIIEAKMTPKLLRNLLIFFKKRSKAISEACWDIHTELQQQYFDTKPNGTTKSGGSPTPVGPPRKETSPLSVLDNEYAKFLKVSTEDAPKKINPANYPWYYSLLELFPTLRNIDRHPLLKGPAYVLYDSLRILNAYLSAYKGAQTIPDLEGIEGIFRRSEENISRFVRCLSRLADQLIQNDDVIFHGLGKEPAIATTLPESLLEFYHGFLRELADYLMMIDNTYDYITDGDKTNYEYGFLLSPEMNQRVRLSKLFKLTQNDRKTSGQKRSWPMKQVYIIQLPAEDVFKPRNCFIPLIHECFHIFGDKLRFRENRFLYMVPFVSAILLAEWGMDVPEAKKQLCKEIDTRLKEGAEQVVSGEIYMLQAVELLMNNLANLLSDQGMEDLYYNASDSGRKLLYTVMVRQRVANTRASYINVKTHQPDEIKESRYIRDCAYYFNECYADIMTITTFNITAQEYLSLFEYELRLFEQEEGDYDPETIARIVGICQRIAVVLAVMNQVGSTVDIGSLFQPPSRFTSIHLGNAQNMYGAWVYSLSKIIEKCYWSLFGKGEQLQAADNGHKLYGVVPPSALSYVVDYLGKVVKFYNEIDSQSPEKNVAALQAPKEHLKKVFDDVIRQEKFFGDSFEEVISQNRKRIDGLAKK